MTKRNIIGTAFVLVMACSAFGQTSSLGARKRAQDDGTPPPTSAREAPKPKVNPVYEQYAWLSLSPPPPKAFRIGDLLTIIVRHQRKFESDADLKTKKEFDLKSEIEAFFRPIDRGLGAATFRRGRPNIDYKFEDERNGKADTSREDRLTTRITVKILDVKPNGLLVIEGKSRVKHDDEISCITITGTCRKEDVTADNTVLSTQIGDLDIAINNKGALKAAASRGWIPKLIDFVRPF